MAVKLSVYDKATDNLDQVEYLSTDAEGVVRWIANSRSGNGVYNVLIRDGEPRCDCPAGSNGLNCWHVLAVQMTRATRAQNGQRIDGRAPAPRRLPPVDEFGL